MSSATRVRNFFLAIAALFIVAACDDDDKKNKKTQYDVTIYVSEHIQGEIIRVPGERRFAKPRIVVQAPEGVKVEHDETKPRKNIVYDFASVALTMLISLGLFSIGGFRPRFARPA